MERQAANFYYHRARGWLQGPLTRKDLESARAGFRAAADFLSRTRAAQTLRNITNAPGAEFARVALECSAECRERMRDWLRERVRLRDTLHGAQLLLWALAAGSLSYCVFACSMGSISHIALARSSAAVAAPAGAPARAQQATPPRAEAHAPAANPAMGSPLGMIEIPRLGVFSIVSQGDSPAILASAVGHDPQTALPGEKGESVMVGRYDTFLRGLDKAKPGDVVAFIGPQMNFYYRVDIAQRGDAHHVTTRSDATSHAPSLVLTAAPASGTGHAGKSFTIVAREESPAP